MNLLSMAGKFVNLLKHKIDKMLSFMDIIVNGICSEL